MIVDGARFQYDFRAKEKQLRATITVQEELIEGLKKELEASRAKIEALTGEIKETKEELSTVRARFRNFKAQVKAPKMSWKEQPTNEVA